MWMGECFVFDERVSINDKLEKGSYLQCFACRSAITLDDKKSKHFIAGVSCPKCNGKNLKNKPTDIRNDKNKCKLPNKKVLDI